jgi:hypothetical protein
MTRWILVLWLALFISGCLDKTNLGKSSFGDDENAQAGAASVISMGRDDDDGAAVKWHIGGGQD